MTDKRDQPDQTDKKTLTLSAGTPKAPQPTLGVRGDAHVQQNFPRGRSKTVTVEVKKRRVGPEGTEAKPQDATRTTAHDGGPKMAPPKAPTITVRPKARHEDMESAAADHLTSGEKGARLRALQAAMKAEASDDTSAAAAAQKRAAALWAADEKPAPVEETTPTVNVAEEVVSEPVVDVPIDVVLPPAEGEGHRSKKIPEKRARDEEAEKKVAPKRMVMAERRHTSKVRITGPLDDDETGGRRGSRRHKNRRHQDVMPTQKIVREVALPDVIVVSELANRMSVRGSEVVKKLMEQGMLVTLNQVIDADTAQIIVEDFGHTVKRVSERDLEETLLQDEVDTPESMQPRAPVVTVMGHVDHGKTSLLDALRETDVAAGEAGGITQHIGAYQVTMRSGAKLTFIDTPGHAAFTEMRARGANVTDIVVLVVAADDGIQQQTIEAIDHAKAAGVPIVVAVNKVDKPDARPEKVRQELLNHSIVVEELGGDVMAIDVSAKKRMNLEALEEAVLLQAEVLELKANPHRAARGAIVEAKLERGRGIVATVLVQKGTLKIGDIFIAGQAYGRVRALIDSHGLHIKEAGPSTPVEVLGWDESPAAGDVFAVVESESKAREVTLYRRRVALEARSVTARGSLDQLLHTVGEGQARELQLILKADVQGSIEAITGSLAKFSNEEVKIRVIHSGVGGINETDISLAQASKALVVGFNVRASAQARTAAQHAHVEIRYYSVIYALIDECKALLEGMLAPTLQEKNLGRAEVRQVFQVGKSVRIAGCMVTEGIMKRGARVRLLRDDVVLYEADLKHLKRFKDDAKEVRDGFECGISLEHYNDLKEGDVFECYEIEEIQRSLADV